MKIEASYIDHFPRPPMNINAVKTDSRDQIISINNVTSKKKPEEAVHVGRR